MWDMFDPICSPRAMQEHDELLIREETERRMREEEYPEKVYLYGMRLRGFSPGCQPKEGFVERLDDAGGKYWDVLVYDRELTTQETRAYALDYIGEGRLH